MIEQTEKTITATTSTTTYSASFFTNIPPVLEHCFIDEHYCWQSDYENQIDIANIKGEKISKDIFHKVFKKFVPCPFIKTTCLLFLYNFCEGLSVCWALPVY